MKYDNIDMPGTERVMLELRELFAEYGFSQYKVSKFEEYDLYMKNKSFLVSDNILTFTDTTGKLMALKPDITLSIIKNAKPEPGLLQKVYYCENVYRTSPGSQGFREIAQTGLECVGDIDLYAACEVIMLAARSLETISGEYRLDLSHMGFMSGLLECGIDEEERMALLKLVGMKNLPELETRCRELGIPENIKEAVCKLTTMYEPLEESLSEMKPYIMNKGMQAVYEELCGVLRVMKLYGVDRKIFVDFSIVNDMSYYNGVIFRGFIDGVPDGVLSGGRYDSLLERVGKKAEAIGFAVYLDKLERLVGEEREFDVDVLLTYGGDESIEDVIKCTEKLTAAGKTVRVSKKDIPELRYRQKIEIGKGGVKDE